MEASQTLKVQGFVEVRKNGLIVCSGQNLIVTAGLDLLASIIGAAGVKPTHLAVGGSGVATTLAMVALQGTEHERVLLTSTTVSTNEVAYLGTFGSGIAGVQIIEEYALLNAGAGGTMLCRFTADPISVDNTDTIDVTWTIAIG